MENPLDLLVRLASIGTAGVSTLAIFIIGRNIHNLPNNSPSWKVSLMRRYQNFCLLMAVICFFSGIANAYLNGAKVHAAERDAEFVRAQYRDQVNAVERYKEQIKREVLTVRTAQDGQLSVRAALNRIDENLSQMVLKPLPGKKSIQSTTQKKSSD